MTVEDMWGARPPRMWKRELRTAAMVLAYSIGMRLAGAAKYTLPGKTKNRISVVNATDAKE
jgi:hypothetical protein